MTRLSRLVLLATLLSFTSTLQGGIAPTQDVLTIGQGSICITGSAGSTVTVPIFVRDVGGTPLGVDQPVANRIQGVSFQVTPTNPSAIAVNNFNLLQITFTTAGVTEGKFPSFESAPRSSTTASYIVNFSEPIAFTSNAAAPGDLFLNMNVQLSPSAVPGTTITFVITPAGATTALSNLAGSVLETTENGKLALVDGCIQVQAAAPPPPVIANFVAVPSTITAGGASRLDWEVRNATTLSINPGLANLAVTDPSFGSFGVSPATTTTYTMTATGPGGTTTATTTVTVNPPPPVITSFTATPPGVTAGNSTTLNWATTNATSVSISGVGAVPVNGSVSVSPATTTTYTLMATGPSGTVTATTTVMVTAPAPTIVSFSATPSTIIEGGSSTLNWTTTNATSVTVTGVGSFPANGSTTVTPTVTTTYTLTATSTGGTATATTTVTVNAAAPTINSFTATPSTITTAGGSATLNWSTTNATGVTIDNGVGSRPANGSVIVTPTVTTTYTLTATGPGGNATSTVTVIVNAAAPVIDNFAANPTVISSGGSSTLTWSTTNATTVSINNGVGVVSANGSVTVSPLVSTTYTLTATGPGGTNTASASVFVSANPPTINSFTANPATITAGGSSVLSWSTSGATSVIIDKGVGSVATSGSISVSPATTTTYTLTANGQGGTVTATTTITVQPPQTEVKIINFSAVPSRIVLGESSTLLFSITGATSVSIDQGIGSVSPNGSVIVRPTVTTRYTLTADGPGGRKTAEVVVEVITVPSILVTTLPSGMIQNTGVGGATDRYVLTNVGGGSTTITLSQTGSFFTQSPSSFTLAPGQSQVITLVGLPQNAGVSKGESIPSGNGVPVGLSIPVKLLSTGPPAGTVKAIPSQNRVDTTLPTGSVEFLNDGTATLQGIVVSDVLWIIPPADVITIGPGQRVTITFTIDRSKRPDAGSPIGSVTGSLSLVYLDGSNVASSTASPLKSFATTPPPATRPITVVDTAAPIPVSAGVPPLQPGEVALVVPGLGRGPGIVSDLLLVNGGSGSNLTGTSLFFTPSGSSGVQSQKATIPTLIPNLPVTLGDPIKTVFNSTAVSGGVQVRATSAIDSLSSNATMFSTLNPKGFFGGSVAVFRSDRSILANEKLFLPGVRKDAGTRSDLYLQETAGTAGQTRTEFLDSRGGVVSSRVDNMSAFGVVELRDAVPSGAVTAVVTNLSNANSASVVAQVLVVDQATGDITNVVDWNRRNGSSSAAPQVLPLLSTSTIAGVSRPRTEMALTNTGTGSATGTLSFLSAPAGSARQRGSRRGTTGSGSSLIEPMAVVASRTITLDERNSQVIEDIVALMNLPGANPRGYLLFTPTSGSFALTARSYAAGSGAAGNFGTAIPVLASSRGAKVGESRRITGLEDGSPANVRSAKPNTFRTGLAMLESAGKETTVRVTLRFAASVPGGLAEVRGTSSKDYKMSAGQFLLFDEIGKEIFGPGRENIGDLHNVQLDVDIISGDGAVIPYTVTTDNGSQDSWMRFE